MRSIPPGVRARLFRDFVTTKASGQGTGFGLRLSAKLIAEDNGSIEVESEVGHGAKFTIRLPLNPPSEDPRQMTPASEGTWTKDVTRQDIESETLEAHSPLAATIEAPAPVPRPTTADLSETTVQ